MSTREAPAWFQAELLRRFGAGHHAEWDAVIQRWVVVSPSAAGYPTRQPFVWHADPKSGLPAKRDAAGLLPMRELDTDGCWYILRNMEASALTNRHDGAQTWAQKAALVTAHNEAVSAAHVREAATIYADMIHDVDLRRPWLKHHSGTKAERRVAWGGSR